MKKQPLTPATKNSWASTAHLLLLEAIGNSDLVEAGQLAFHGGTSLRLSWTSPRFSEDLDFLLDRQVKGVDRLMSTASRHVEERLRAIDPLFEVALVDRSKRDDRLAAFMLTVSHPGYYGVAKVKTEFWRVDATYLAGYPSTLRRPEAQGDDVMAKVAVMVRAAELESAFCDKLTAFATRPFLKWRDMFDLWWIGTQTDARLDTSAIANQFKHNVSAYHTVDGLSPAAALRRFAAQDRDALEKKADPDLKQWLPTHVWKQLQGSGVHDIVQYTCSVLNMVADRIECVSTVPARLPKRNAP